MNSDQTTQSAKRKSTIKSMLLDRNWRIGAWLPWVLLHIFMSHLLLNYGGGGFDVFGLLFYFLFSWAFCAVTIVILIFHRKNALSYLITIVMLLLGPALSSHYLGNKRGAIIEKAHLAAEEVTRLCEEQGGDKIYRTVEGVEGIFQMVPMPDFHKGINDQFGRVFPWHRGMGESDRMNTFTSHGGEGYLFVEHLISIDQSGPPYLRTVLKDSGRSLGDQNPNQPHPERPLLVSSTIEVNKLRSRYGWFSEDLTSSTMRRQWISGGRITLIDLKTKEVLAETTGFSIGKGIGGFPWYKSNIVHAGCPKSGSILTFMTSVLIPPSEYPTREKLDSLRE